LRNSLIALQVRVGDAHRRDEKGQEHQGEDRSSLHLFSLLPACLSSDEMRPDCPEILYLAGRSPKNPVIARYVSTVAMTSLMWHLLG
jgi:hypothetical protein